MQENPDLPGRFCQMIRKFEETLKTDEMLLEILLPTAILLSVRTPVLIATMHYLWYRGQLANRDYRYYMILHGIYGSRICSTCGVTVVRKSHCCEKNLG